MANTTKVAETQAIMARAARRSKGVVERLAPQHPAIAACGLTLRPSADALIAAQDKLDAARMARRKQLVARTEQATAVRNTVRSWLAVARRDVEDFGSELDTKSDVPTDVLTVGLRVLELTRSVPGVAEQAYAAPLIEQLGAQVEALERAESEAHAARFALQSVQTEAREAGLRLQVEVVALRRVLRATVGVRHVDYQLLRTTRVGQADDEPEESSASSASAAEERDEPSGAHRIPIDPHSPPRAVNG